MSQPRRSAAIMFADIVGYTAMIDGYRYLAKIHMHRGKDSNAINILERAIDELNNRAPFLIGGQ